MPRYPIERSTNFIVEAESWSVVEYDHTSVPGVIYLSLTENKINLIYDDLNNNVADTDKMAQYNLALPLDIQRFKVGEEINPIFTLTKNGVPIDLEVELSPTNKSCAKIIDGRLTAVGEGITDIIVQLKDYPQIQKTLSIEISSDEPEFSAYIDGIANIRLARTAIYELKGITDFDGPVIFSLDNSLAKIISTTDKSCEIEANEDNKLGYCTLTAIYNNITYTKTIQIIPLW